MNRYNPILMPEVYLSHIIHPHGLRRVGVLLVIWVCHCLCMLRKNRFDRK